MTSICSAGIPPVSYVDCDPCIDRYFSFEDTVMVTPPEGGPSYGCRITRKYRWHICEVGLGVGRHLHSLTLLPGEEVELEIVRKHKFTSSLSAQNSVEEEVETELQFKLLEEWSKSEEVSGKFNHSGGIKIFGIGGKTTQDYQRNVEKKESRLSEVVSKTASSVSRKFELAMSLKTEVDNKFRSLRKVRNPNPCQPVTYHHFQIMKRYRRELFLVEQTYDCTPPAGLVNGGPKLTFSDEIRPPTRMPPQVVPVPPSWNVANDRKGALAGYEGSRAESIRGPDIDARLESPTSRELSRDEILAEIKAEGLSDTHAAAIVELDRLADPSGGGLIFSEEYCIGTDSVFVQAQVSDCGACEDSTIRMKELEVQRLELELKKLECEIELCKASEKGYGGVDPV